VGLGVLLLGKEEQRELDGEGLATAEADAWSGDMLPLTSARYCLARNLSSSQARACHGRKFKVI